MLKRIMLLLTLTLALPSAFAAQLADPTRPSGADVTAAAPGVAPIPLKLTLIRLGSQPIAIINGTTLKPGDRIGDYKLLSLHPGHAVLAGSSDPLTLSLIPSLHPSFARHTKKP